MKFIDILQESKKEIPFFKLPYNRSALDPVVSKKTVDLHYGTLTKNYFIKFNDTGDEFQHAGAVLHEIWWNNLNPLTTGNTPKGKILNFINKKFNDFNTLQTEFEKAALGIQGSGWVYLSNTGKVKTIKNHEIYDDIILILDMWEHSFILDYGADKKKYINNFWKIVNWEYVESRLG